MASSPCPSPGPGGGRGAGGGRGGGGCVRAGPGRTREASDSSRPPPHHGVRLLIGLPVINPSSSSFQGLNQMVQKNGNREVSTSSGRRGSRALSAHPRRSRCRSAARPSHEGERALVWHVPCQAHACACDPSDPNPSESLRLYQQSHRGCIDSSRCDRAPIRVKHAAS